MPTTPNQNPEQRARDVIDAQLEAAGWAVQSKNMTPTPGRWIIF